MADPTTFADQAMEHKGSLYSAVAFRFDSSELGGTWTEICAYGTAVKVRKLS